MARIPKIINLSADDPGLEKKLETLAKQLQLDTLAMSEKLGRTLKRRGKWSLKQLLRDMGYGGLVPAEMLDPYMDWLIIQRSDMREHHEGARERLRVYYLSKQDVSKKTKDYLGFVEDKEYPDGCGECLWFMIAPEDEDKTCVERGSRGIDRACFGFTKNHGQNKL